MEKRKILIFLSGMVVLFTFVLMVFKLVPRNSTSIEITSISPTDPSLGETVRVDFKVFGGTDEFSIVVLPDTQHYSDAHPEIFFAQTQWIVNNKFVDNIIFVSHLGDIVQNNDYFEDEWRVANAAMGVLDEIMPYGILPGNHDMQFGGDADFYTVYFPASRFNDSAWWGGSFNENKNNFQLISAAGDDYIFLHLQYCPPDAAIDWANEVLSNFSDHNAIISTHSYLLADGRRVGHCQEKSDGDNNGFDIWKKVVRRNPNIFLVLSGHIPGAFRRSDQVDGRVVYQLLSDYQDMRNGGDGYLRIMTFQPNLDTVLVKTYSPALDAYLTDPENQFDLSFDMTGGRSPSGKVTVSSGTESCQASLEIGFCDLTVKDGEPRNITVTYSGDLFFHGSVSEPFSYQDQ